MEKFSLIRQSDSILVNFLDYESFISRRIKRTSSNYYFISYSPTFRRTYLNSCRINQYIRSQYSPNRLRSFTEKIQLTCHC